MIREFVTLLFAWLFQRKEGVSFSEKAITLFILIASLFTIALYLMAISNAK
ncbi:hypothetical protein N9R81_04200 [Flavobacteriales bacterium]|nr:hypothetical protein [Flavobacteriales bacterium]